MILYCDLANCVSEFSGFFFPPRYQIIFSCWALSAQSRPTFVQLMKQLSPYVAAGDHDGGLESQPLAASVDIGGADDYKDFYN